MVNRVSRLVAASTYGLLAYMPFHIFFVQSLSLVTGGLSIWKAAKDGITAALVGIAVVLVWYRRRASKLFYIVVGFTVAYGLIHLAVWAINPAIYRPTALEGLVYNNRLLWCLVLGLAAVRLEPQLFSSRRIARFLVIISSIVAVLGILQYFLPKDILTHVGYSVARGVKPAFFIDDKPDLPRIMSTLRDPNSLGAYLILPMNLLFAAWWQCARRRLLIGGLFALHALALFLTFSRGAWLGAVITLGSLLVWQQRQWLKQHAAPLAVMAVIVVGGLGMAAYVARDQYVVQNVILHSDESTVAPEDSNALHARFLEQGLRSIAQRPQGYGPGTAGIVSIRNPRGGHLTEDYYIQLGYEVGVIGLLVFMGAAGYVVWELGQRARVRGQRAEGRGQRNAANETLAVCLMVSFAGYSVMCLFMHLWSNEAVMAQWWLAAGLSLGMGATGGQKESARRT